VVERHRLSRSNEEVEVAPTRRRRSAGALIVAPSLLAAGLLGIAAAPSPAGASLAVSPVVQAITTSIPASTWSLAVRSAGTGMRPLSGPLTSVVTPANQLMVLGLNRAAKVTAMINDGANGRAWNAYNLSAATSTPSVNQGLAAIVSPSNQLDVFAVTTGGHLEELSQSGASWSATDLSSLTGATGLIGGASASVNNGQLVVAVRNQAGDLIEVTADNQHNNTWNAYDLTQITSGPALTSNLAAIGQGPSDGLIHLFGRAANGDLVEYVDNNAGGRVWNSYDTTAASGGSVTIKSDPSATIYTGRLRVVATAPGGHVVQFTGASSAGGTTWTTKDLTQASGGTAVLKGAPVVSVAGSALVVAGTTTTKHLVTIEVPAPAAGPITEDISQASPGVPSFTGRATIAYRNNKLSVLASALTLPVAGSVGVYAYPSASQAISDGWSVVGDTGALGTCGAPYTGLQYSPADLQTGLTIQNSGRQIPWLSFWTVSGPTHLGANHSTCRADRDESPGAFYNDAYQSGVFVAKKLDSYANQGLGIKPTSVIIDDEGYPDAHSGFYDTGNGADPARAAQFASYVQGWTDGLHKIDPSLNPGVYIPMSEYTTFHVASLPIDAYIAVAWGGSQPPVRLPGVDGANIKGFIAFFINDSPAQECALAPSAVRLLSSWGAPNNTLQFDAGVTCKPNGLGG